jgi:hypothetical protein
MRTQLLPCPQCGNVAELDWRARRHGRGPGRELVKIRCVRRHWYLMPADQLEWYPDEGAAA